MKPSPFHVWWVGIVLFGPAVLMWIAGFILFHVKGMLDIPFDWHAVKSIYLPFAAALLGLCVPVVCLRLLRKSPTRKWAPVFAIYATLMLTWGIIDIRSENYQIGGHSYPNGPLIDGHRYYYHSYITWYFLPYRWIEKGID